MNFKRINEISVPSIFMLLKISSEIEPPLQIQNANEEQLKFSCWSNWTKGALFPHFPYIGVKVCLKLYFKFNFIDFLLLSHFMVKSVVEFTKGKYKIRYPQEKLNFVCWVIKNLDISLEIEMLKIQSCHKCQLHKMFF